LLGEIHRAVFGSRPLCGVTAGSDEENLGSRFDNILQRDSEGWCARFAEDIFTARARNHFRNPVAAHIERLQPFEEGNPRAMRGWIEVLFELTETRADFLE
jgi:fido (protein-threonine AMPylation protein)